MASAVKEHFLFSYAQLDSLIEVVWLLRCCCLQHVLSAFKYLADYTEVPSDSHNRCKSFEFFGPFFYFLYLVISN